VDKRRYLQRRLPMPLQEHSPMATTLPWTARPSQTTTTMNSNGGGGGVFKGRRESFVGSEAFFMVSVCSDGGERNQDFGYTNELRFGNGAGDEKNLTHSSHLDGPDAGAQRNWRRNPAVRGGGIGWDSPLGQYVLLRINNGSF